VELASCELAHLNWPNPGRGITKCMAPEPKPMILMWKEVLRHYYAWKYKAGNVLCLVLGTPLCSGGQGVEGGHMTHTGRHEKYPLPSDKAPSA
jgi:hypothetical protein